MRYTLATHTYVGRRSSVSFDCVPVATRLDLNGNPNGVLLVEVTHGGTSWYVAGDRVDVNSAALMPSMA